MNRLVSKAIHSSSHSPGVSTDMPYDLYIKLCSMHPSILNYQFRVHTTDDSRVKARTQHGPRSQSHTRLRFTVTIYDYDSDWLSTVCMPSVKPSSPSPSPSLRPGSRRFRLVSVFSLYLVSTGSGQWPVYLSLYPRTGVYPQGILESIRLTGRQLKMNNAVIQSWFVLSFL